MPKWLKGWLALVLSLAFASGVWAAAPQFPTLSGPVVDGANLLGADARAQLATQLTQFQKASGMQLVVVTLPNLQGYPIEDFGYQLGRAWGIGQKDKNNGVLLIVAQSEHRVRIEVGYGLEGTLTDALCANIIQTVMLPRFKTGQFPDGIEQGVQAIQAALRGEYQSAAPPEGANQHSRGMGLLIFMLMLGAVIFLRSLGGPGGGMGGRRGLFLPGLFLGGGFGGGGGFSGGGGSFGGGGASGGW